MLVFYLRFWQISIFTFSAFYLWLWRIQIKQGGGGKTKVVGKLSNGMKLVAGLSPSLFHITSTRVAACDSASIHISKYWLLYTFAVAKWREDRVAQGHRELPTSQLYGSSFIKNGYVVSTCAKKAGEGGMCGTSRVTSDVVRHCGIRIPNTPPPQHHCNKKSVPNFSVCSHRSVKHFHIYLLILIFMTVEINYVLKSMTRIYFR